MSTRHPRKRRFDKRVLTEFPPVGGNSVVVYEHGVRYFDRMVAAMEAASSSIDVEMYLWHDDDVGRLFVDVLAQGAARGLRVRVLADAHGAAEIFERLRAVTASGGDVRVFSPFRIRLFRRYFHRTHKKLLIVDGRTAFGGGAGFSLHWSSGKHDERPWHDRMFEISGPVVAQLGEVFDADFSRWEPLEPGAAPRAGTPGERAPPGPSGPSEMRVLRGWPDARDFRETLLGAVRSARERVWLGTPYFIPAFSLRRALRDAARRGVDVQVIHPAENFAHTLVWYAARARYGASLKGGVKLHEYGKSFYHAKIAVIDRGLAIVGSSNLDPWSWRRNAESDIAITDAATVEHAAELFREDLAASRAVTPDEAGIAGLWRLAKGRWAILFERWM